MTWKLITAREKPPKEPLLTPEEARLQGRCDCDGCGACWGGSACGITCNPGEQRCTWCRAQQPYAELVRRRRVA